MCKAVRFTLKAKSLPFVVCHCRDCQYASGGGPTYVLAVPREGVNVSNGEESIRSFSSLSDSGHDVTRQFCFICGSHLFELLQLRPGIKLVRVGALDDPSGLQIDATVWITSAQPWAYVDPGTRLFDRNPEPLLDSKNRWVRPSRS